MWSTCPTGIPTSRGRRFRGQWITGSKAFKMPIPGTFGNVSRGSLRGPGLVDVDTSLFKKFRISERWNVQLRAEAFNIFNHSNFAFPNQIVFEGNSSSYRYSDSAGAITNTATTSRQVQLALKLLF